MPHIIVEYTNILENKIPNLLSQLHDSLANSGIDKGRIKTRALPLQHNIVGNQCGGGAMLHATLLLLEGRDLATKKSYGDPLYELLCAAAPDGCAVTLELRDMNKDTYYM